jgi:beta-mannosidase
VLTGFQVVDTAGDDPPPDDAAWQPAVVPGGVHESLLAAGLLDDPCVGTNEDAARWVEERTWWYRCTFHGPDSRLPHERLRLVCHGLDGVAAVWLNGTELGRHANQHRPAVFDVTALVQADNQLLIRFTPPLDGLVDDDELAAALDGLREAHRRIRPGDEPDEERLALRVRRARLRKAACAWGWDFALRLPSIGLHRPVELVRVRDAVIAGVHARTARLDLTAQTATVSVDVDLDTTCSTPDVVRVTLTDPVGRSVVHEVPAASRGGVELEVSDVTAWWTHDLGDQPLYELRTELLRAGAVLDTRVERIGIRTLELDTEVDEIEGGCRFRFLLNGVPVFARGANWVPASQLVGSISDDRYRELVELARHGQMNMLRVWGGGIYEAAAFYSACDELGILVWQDFMFACDTYPSEDLTLAEEVRLEAEHQVRRLRNHPALALWAGNNEVQMIRELVGDDLEPGSWGWSFFHELLPDVVRRHSPGALYWPGSPWGELDSLVNGVSDGDRHAWEVWHGVDVGAGGPNDYPTRGDAVHFRRYEHDRGRFISEFGIHAAPELQTLASWLPPEALTLRHPVLDHHNKDTPKDKGWALMEVETGLPETLHDYIDFSMACQAEGLKLGVEHYRRRQPQCSGTLVWQFNDVWPALSWSVVDYDGRPKAAFYFLQRAYQPVVATFRVEGDDLELWVTNSSRLPDELELAVEVVRFDGQPLASELVRVRAEAHSSRVVWRGAVPDHEAFAWVSDRAGRVAANRRFFGPLRSLPLTGRVDAVATRTGPTTAQVELCSTGYSYLARVTAGFPGTRCDTNYVDLRDGASQVVTISGWPEDADLSPLTVATYGSRPRPVTVTVRD